MKIEHIALWVKDLEQIKEFYTTYFKMTCGEKYVNEAKGFSSYFLSFEGAETRFEIMHRTDVAEYVDSIETRCGFTHLAISVGNKFKVDELTEKLRAEGYIIFSEPRITGDGYYESVVLDPEGNQIEITE